MLFLWETTNLGKIWIDGDAIKEIITKRLPNDLYLQDLSFTGEKNLLNVHIVASDGTDSDTKGAVEKRLGVIFDKLGVVLQINWLNVAPQDNKKTTPIWTLPLFWAAVAAGIAALFHMGIKGILWSIFAAIIGYGASWILISQEGQRQIKAIKEHFRR